MRILIVGGGIAGLSAAIALRQAGFAPELIERRSEWPAAGSGIVMHANAMRVLHRLGLGKAVEREGAVLRRWSFADARGAALFGTDLETMWDDSDVTVGIAPPRLHKIRRRPRVEWVQRQSWVAEREWTHATDTQLAVLRARGDEHLRERYRPLTTPP